MENQVKTYIALQALFNGKKQLNAKKGETLKVIRDYTEEIPVAIVENQSGERFSVRKELLITKS